MSMCWSFNRAGRRCERPAGHEGDHSIEETWADAEAWTPSESNVTVVPVVDLPMMEDKPKTTANVRKCAVCDHPWHNQECERKTQGLPCGCTTALE